MIEYHRKLEEFQQFAPELEAFISMKQLEKKVLEKGEFLVSIINTESFRDRELSYHGHAFIQKLVTDVRKYGEIIINKKACDVSLKRRKNNQTEIIVPHSLCRSVENTFLQLHQTINILRNTTSGCCMMPDGRMVFSDWNDNTVSVFNTDGSKNFEISIKQPFDIAYFSEDNTLAVTSYEYPKCCISMIDIHSKSIEKQIPLDIYYSCLYGIAVKDTKLICSTLGGIQLIDPYNNSRSYIVQDRNFPDCCYVAMFGDKIYSSNRKSNSVTCYNLQGTVQWTFKNESVLETPRGISVDNDGKVYVIGQLSNNVLVISADGQQHKEILTASDGLSGPQYLYYNRGTNQLLVAKNQQNAMLLTVI
ncbi:unnamed protein product [Mytilus edulis]|uniref:Uncharacterized protein n=1 Tax=Mytilus edulis TaxID=6550 RepID=A0A8S3TGL4_MYTED|nr:unnamed protein product [Mytilus edulis]